MFKALSSNPVLAALLIWMQVLGGIAGPAGLVLCRDTDGSSHVEFLSDSCCALDLEAGGGEPESRISDASDPWCSEDECDDSLLLGDPLSTARATLRVAGLEQGSSVVAPDPYGFPLNLRVPLVVGRTPVGTAADGLRPVRLGLRSTVLVL